MSHPPKASLWPKLGLSAVVLLILFALFSLPSFGYGIIVDGDASDWTMTATGIDNLAHLGRNAANQGEYIWTDASGDERTDFGSPDTRIDLTEFRVTADQNNLYFLAKMTDIDQMTGDEAPMIQIAIDTDQISGSGESFMAAFSDTEVDPDAEWEYLAYTRFNETQPTLWVWQNGFSTQVVTGTNAISDVSEVIEIALPWTALDLSAPPATPLRFSVAVFRGDASGNTYDIGSSSDALDALTNYGVPGTTPNTFNEVSDGVLNYYFDLYFTPDGEVYPPVVLSEVYYEATDTDGDNEWLEIYNHAVPSVDLANYKVGDEETIGGGEGMAQFPITATMSAGDVFVVALKATGFQALNSFLPDFETNATDGSVPDMRSYTAWASNTNWALGNDGDEVLLLDGSDTVVDVVAYDGNSWPGVTNTGLGSSTGETLARTPVTQDTNDVTADFSVIPSEGNPGVVVLPAPTITATKTSAYPGPTVAYLGELTYTVLISNTGLATDPNVTLTETLPADVEFGYWVEQPSGTGFADVDVITWSGAIDVSEIVTLTFVVTHTGTYEDILTNTVEFSGTNNSDSVQVVDTVISAAPDLEVSKTGPSIGGMGLPLVYDISVSNVGAVGANNVILTDTLPTGATYLSDDSGVTCNACIVGATGPLTFELGSIGFESAANFQLTVTLGSALLNPSVMTNVITASTPSETNLSNNSALAETTVYTVVSIYDIQQVSNPAVDDVSPFDEQMVWTEGVVTAEPGEINSGTRMMVIQDENGGPWSGLPIFDSGGISGSYPLGTKVRVLGEIGEYTTLGGTNQTQMSPPSEIISLTTTTPLTPHLLATSAFSEAVAADSEQWEGVLIGFTNTQVVDDNLGNGEWAMADSNGDIVRVNDLGDQDGNLTYVPVIGDMFEFVYGFGWQSFGDYKLEPRFDADLSQITPPELTLSKDVSPTGLDVGEVLTYTVFVNNTGSVTATGVLFTDTLPLSATFANTISFPAGTTRSGGNLLWTGDIDPGTTLGFTWTMTNTAPSGSQIDNTAIANGPVNIISDTATYEVAAGGFVANRAITLTQIGNVGLGGAEIMAHDPVSQTLYVVTGGSATNNSNYLEVLDISDPTAPTLAFSITLDAYGEAANSVDVYDGIVAVAMEANPAQDPGHVVFFDRSGNYVYSVTVGALPDMLTFTPDGQKVLVANEGEPSDDYTVDPEGSVSVIDVSSGIPAATVTNLDFTHFSTTTISTDVRIFGPGATVAQDLEPEYIAVSSDVLTAWVTLQENNALAVVDLQAMTITQILPLGYKDHSLPLNAFDPSDRDSGIEINPWPVWGMYQPDAIASFEIDGMTYLITANEGDARDYTGFSEEARVKNITLDASIFTSPTIADDAELGRLNVTTATGDIDNDNEFEELYAYGARSFSIWAADGSQVMDSGWAIELITAVFSPTLFNSEGELDGSGFDKRSDNKGPEPEGVVTFELHQRMYAVIGLERIGGLLLADITDPLNWQFVNYFPAPVGDFAPEGLRYIAPANSPNGMPLLSVAYEDSGTISLFEITPFSPPVEVLINELDSDMSGTENTEFIELYDGGVGNTALDGTVVVLFNGSDDASYQAFDLDGYSTNANGYFVIGGTAITTADLVVSSDYWLQNGADAVAIYQGDATDFPNGTPLTTANLIDALVYETGDSDDAGLLVLLNAGQPQVDEDANGNKDGESVQRCPNGSGNPLNTDTFAAFAPTPGFVNDCTVPPTANLTISEIQGPGDSSPYNGLPATTEGIVTAVDMSEFTFIQMRYTNDMTTTARTGLALIDGLTGLSVGDYITATGTVQERFGKTVLNVTAFSVLSSANTLPPFAVLPTGSAADEDWESVLVRAENVTVTDQDLGFEEWQIDDDSGPLAVDDLSDAGYSYVPQNGDTLAYVQGPLAYTFGAFKIVPRDDADIQRLITQPSIEKIGSMNVESGDTFTYSITVLNEFEFDLSDVTISDVLPAGTGFVSASDGGSFDGSTVVWSTGTLTAGESLTVSLVVTASAAEGTIINNVATVTATNFITPTASNTTTTLVGSLFPIYTIQGDALRSPFEGLEVETSGVVVGFFEGNADNDVGGDFDGLFLQDPTGDADDSTSDGIFVDYGNLSLSVAIGDIVTVTGVVEEYVEWDGSACPTDENECMTQIAVASAGDVVIGGSSAITPTELNPPGDPVAAVAYFESVEGMLVTIPNTATVVGPTSYNTIHVIPGDEGVDRALRGSPYEGMPVGLRHYEFRGDINGNDAPGLIVGSVVEEADGPLTFSYGDYLIATQDNDPWQVVITKTAPITLPTAPALNPGEFSVGSFNMLNFSDDPDEDKLPKIVDTIAQMGYPSFLAVQEISVADKMTDVINSLAGSGINYEFANSHPDVGSHGVALMWRTDHVTNVAISTEYQGCSEFGSGSSVAYDDYCADTGLLPLFSRRPVVLTGSVFSGTQTSQIAVIANHFKSKRDGFAGDMRRLGQAELVQDVAADLLIDGYHVIVAGDLNDFEDSPPVSALYANDALTNTWYTLAPEARYSYIFEGVSQVLDHVLASPSLMSDLVAFTPLHLNADYPFSFGGDNSTPLGASDHDVLVATFTLPTAPPELSPALMVQKTVATPGEVSVGDVVTYTITISNSGLGVAQDVLVTDTLPTGLDFGGFINQGSASLPAPIVWGPSDVPGLTEYSVSFTATVAEGSAGTTITNVVDYSGANVMLGSDSVAFSVAELPPLTDTYGVSLTADSPALSGLAGQTVTYTVSVSNTGSTTDTFNLSLSGQQWTTTAPTTVGPLASGAGSSVAVSVTIPATATITASDTVTLTATSQADAATSDSVTLTTSITTPETPTIFLPIVLK